jgi:xanthine/uracil/vitamin C permease (AzgA family)
MGIASVKAGIVTLIFMHLNYESKIIWGIVIYPIFIFILLVAGTLGDNSLKKQPVPYSSDFSDVSGNAIVVKE